VSRERDARGGGDRARDGVSDGERDFSLRCKTRRGRPPTRAGACRREFSSPRRRRRRRRRPPLLSPPHAALARRLLLILPSWHWMGSVAMREREAYMYGGILPAAAGGLLLLHLRAPLVYTLDGGRGWAPARAEDASGMGLSLSSLLYRLRHFVLPPQPERSEEWKEKPLVAQPAITRESYGYQRRRRLPKWKARVGGA